MKNFCFIVGILLAPAQAIAQLSPEAISKTNYAGGPLPEGQSAITVVVQVLLDRAAISPGVIDGFRGPMSRSAIRAFEAREGLEADGVMDSDVWKALDGDDRGQILRSYRITEEDAVGLTDGLPDDYAKLAKMDWLGYTSVAERLAEDFHMDQAFLRNLNPDAAFQAGETIFVAATGDPIDATVTRVEVRKDVGRVAAFSKDDIMVANYPATVGSAELPSPSGTHEITAIAIEPTYTYRPDENFRQGDNDEILVLPPGANGPVGIVWIDLSKPTYGIHGTSDPDELFQDQSHGCVRLTNWDARELAGMVDQGTAVSFVSEDN
ncbi:L,D-transpeptidase [Loktanella sp. SALINAS62]|uniref:L,D-transpeptidase family protein n=1 Tax=Loktanella sp. SALINAS62 TaxID=2706124 RepID=UPI001B8D8F0F|nr:L,D-transpeptidase [Loktanella sp. SALINAS62]MBS1302744.1 murein L,D-transpeptidase [Loktanella sp. SALINAS62]